MFVSDKTGIKGKVSLAKFECSPEFLAKAEEAREKGLPKPIPGTVQRLPKTRLQRLFKRPGSVLAIPSSGCKLRQVVGNHNIVTDQGDALLVDALSTTPARTLPNNANAVIGVGTGFVSAIKTRTGLTTITGSYEAMDATYPKQKGAWAAANDNVLQFQSTFEAGDLNASGIDEIALSNGTDNLAYAEVTPNINMTASDSLVALWELTFLGA